MKATTIGIDLAKEVFQIHEVNEHGKRLFNKQLNRSQIASLFCQYPTLLDRHGGLCLCPLLGQ